MNTDTGQIMNPLLDGGDAYWLSDFSVCDSFTLALVFNRHLIFESQNKNKSLNTMNNYFPKMKIHLKILGI